MSNSEKIKFLAGNLARVLEKNTSDFRETTASQIKSMNKDVKFDSLTEMLKEMVNDSIRALEEWEKTPLNELDGITPENFINSIDEFGDIVEIMEVFERHAGICPVALVSKLKSIDESYYDSVINELNALRLDDEKNLTSRQKAVIRIAEIIGSEKFVNPLAEIISQIDDEKSNDRTIGSLMDALREIGHPAVSKVINLSEKSNKESRVYGELMNVLGKIASKNKNDVMFTYLKDCFRKSESKFVEANALAAYGDGRAVTAIRGYVEKNKGDIPYNKYTIFKNSIHMLGGSTDDLDRYFNDGSTRH